MPLSWSTLPDSQLCIVSGEGTVTRSDIDTYLAGTVGEGAKGYAKLVDITTCTLALDADDLETVAHRLLHYGKGERPGPVAMVVGSALNLDMAILLKQRAGDRPFRIFTTIGALTLLGMISAIAVVVYGYHTTQLPAANADFKTATTFVYYNDGKSELGSFAIQNRTPLTFDKIPETMKQAAVAAENRTFWTDQGISIRGMIRAAWEITRA